MRKIFVLAGCAGVAIMFGLWTQALSRPTEQSLSEPPITQSGDAVQPTLSGIVVPHHDIVRARRAELFSTIHKRFFLFSDPQTIIIISPNHFEQGKGDVQTTDLLWHTSDGDIAPNKEIIDQLSADKIATKETDSFAREHGISLILGDIKKTFPHASLVPIIIKRNTSEKEIDRLATSLNARCPACFVVASVDFSHYQPALLGALHDQLSLRALQNRDIPLLLKHAEVDSPASLAFLAQWAILHHTERFTLFDHTNSGVISGHPDEEATTHIFGWYEQGVKNSPPNTTTFMIGGDMMFGRSVGYRYESRGYTKLFDLFGERVFWGVDAALVNLEGPITTAPVRYDPALRSLTFLFPKKSISALSYLHIDGVSLANNHTLNHGQIGFSETRSLLKKNGISSIGDPAHVSDTSVSYFDGQGIRLAVIGVHALIDSHGTVELIKKIKKDAHTRILVFPHWGIEYALVHSRQQETLARSWIDAGADVIIGAHPHVIEDVDVYRGKPIIYSLGNFIFDQTFSKNTQQGLLVGGSFSDTGLSLYLFPLQTKGFQPFLLQGKEKQTIIDRITKNVQKYQKQSDAGSFLFFPFQ